MTGPELPLREMIEKIPILAWSCRSDGTAEFLNQRWLDYTGLSLEESLGRGWQAAIHAEDLGKFMDTWLPLLTTGKPGEQEARLRRFDGEYRRFLFQAVPIRDKQGNVIRWYGTTTDIEDRKQAEEIRAAQVRQAGVRADVSAAFSKPADLREMLRGCAEAIVRHLDAAFARIWMLNKDENMLELQASAGMYTRLDGSHSRIPVGALKVGLIAKEKKAHLTNDVLHDPRISDKAWAQAGGFVSFAGYPLIVEERVVGVMALFACHPLSVTTLDVLASVGDAIAQGIERKLAEEAQKRTRDRIIRQQAATLTLVKAPFETLEGTIRRITEVVAETLAVERVSVWTFNEDRTAIQCLDLFHLTERRHEPGTTLTVTQYPRYFAALEESLTIAAEHAQTDPRTSEFTEGYLGVLGISSMLDAPIRHRAITLGVVCHEHVGAPREWTLDEQNFAGSIADLVSLAFETSERKRAEAMLGGEKRLLEMIAKGNSLPSILDALCRFEEELAPRSLCSILLLDADGRRLTHGAAPSLPTSYTATVDGLAIGPSVGSCGTAAFRRETVIVSDISTDPLWAGAPCDLALRHGLRACWSTPIFSSDGKVLGTFAIYHRHACSPTPTQHLVIQQFTHLAAVAIERKLAEEALRKSQGDLAHVARVATLGEMTASIAHEINQPLAAVVNNASACLRWLAAQNLAEARQSAARVITDGHRASEIIQRIRALAQKAPPRKDRLDLNDTIREVVTLTRSEVQVHRVSLQMQLADDVPVIPGDRIQLQQVLLNLMMNAIEAMSGVGEGPRELWVGTERDGSQSVLVSVRDSGPGLDPRSLDRLFDAFYTTKPHGLGMGLAISRSIVEAHGGRLWATANMPRGAIFQFTVPTDGERMA